MKDNFVCLELKVRFIVNAKNTPIENIDFIYEENMCKDNYFSRLVEWSEKRNGVGCTCYASKIEIVSNPTKEEIKELPLLDV